MTDQLWHESIVSFVIYLMDVILDLNGFSSMILAAAFSRLRWLANQISFFSFFMDPAILEIIQHYFTKLNKFTYSKNLL